MSSYNSDCPPLDVCGPCGTLPPGFVRLRYFFGKRMGVADFVDDQRYHAGKMQFHNQRLHGAGLLCGLAVVRQSAADVILRVGKGAAIDSCGREIVVGYDQCIDLDGWYQRVQAEQRALDPTWPAPALDSDGNLPLVVAIRYAECGASPEPAPRDPCACDAAGCDFGRVREEFELDLMSPDAPELVTTAPVMPPRDDLARAVGRARGGTSLARGLADAAARTCAEPDPGGWLPLADIVLALATDTAGVDHVDDVVAITGRASLLAETALIQELMYRHIGAHLEAGALVGGPEIASLSLDRPAADDVVSIWLSAPVIAETVPPQSAFLLHALDTGGSPGWGAAQAVTVDAAEAAAAEPRIQVTIPAGFLADGGLYRLSVDVPSATPIVDDHMRVLSPAQPRLQFAVALESGSLAIDHAPYAR